MHAFEGSALHTLRAARADGAVAVLDVPSAHEFLIQIAREEGDTLDERWFALETPRIHRERAVADYLLAASALAERCLTEHEVPKGKIVRIPYGVDAHRFTFGARDRSRPDSIFRVLYAGRIDSRKGLGYLLEAWVQLRLPNAELVVVGSADRFGRRLLGRYSAHCQWRGSIPYGSMHREFEAATMFVCPSLAETGPLVVYEAMASSLPVVTTEAAQAVVRDGVDGFVVPTRNSEAIAERILWLYERSRERRKMGANGRQRVLESFTWDHYHQRVITAYWAMLWGRDPNEAIAELEAGWQHSVAKGVSG